MLTGITVNTIDSKSRVVIPQDLRNQILGDGDVYLTFGLVGDEHCIRVYSVAAYEELYRKIQELRAEGTHDTSGLQALYIRPARRVSFDANGRILLTAEMKNWAKITDEARETSVSGNIDFVEIWSKAELDASYENIDKSALNAASKIIGVL
ncbi:MAG: hypothetical protein IKI41_02695 [Clostridia bacterium]|nr:hypothetical protein [Clostridia bacterium]MBR7077634.1 hypothetical protein [Clostridia bacterium]